MAVRFGTHRLRASTSIAVRTTNRDDRETPLMRAGWQGYAPVFRFSQRSLFLQRGLDTFLENRRCFARRGTAATLVLIAGWSMVRVGIWSNVAHGSKAVVAADAATCLALPKSGRGGNRH